MVGYQGDQRYPACKLVSKVDKLVAVVMVMIKLLQGKTRLFGSHFFTERKLKNVIGSFRRGICWGISLCFWKETI